MQPPVPNIKTRIALPSPMVMVMPIPIAPRSIPIPLFNLIQTRMRHQMIHIHNPVQMVNLVLQSLRQQTALRIHLKRLRIQVQRPRPHLLRPQHHPPIPRNAQTPLLHLPLPLLPHNLRVHQNQSLLHIRRLHNRDTLQIPNLIRRQPHPAMLNHRLHHIRRQPPVLRRNLPNLTRLPEKNRVRHQPNLQQSHQKTLNLKKLKRQPHPNYTPPPPQSSTPPKPPTPAPLSNPNPTPYNPPLTKNRKQTTGSPDVPNKTPESQQPLEAAAPRTSPPTPDSFPLNSNIATLGYLFFSLNALFFACLSVANPGAYSTITYEDSWVEYLTPAWFLLTALILFATALAEQRLPLRCVYILAAIAFLFAAGEELSWGQRIIGFPTPDFLLNINRQDEVNLHNINITHGKFEAIYQVATTLLCMITAAAFFIRKDKLFNIPLPSILLVLAFLTAESYRPVEADILSFDFISFITDREKALLLFFAIYALISRQPKEILAATAAAFALLLAIAYAHHRSDIPAGNFYETREYLFSIVCFFYALDLLLAQKPAHRRLATPFAALKLPTSQIPFPPKLKLPISVIPFPPKLKLPTGWIPFQPATKPGPADSTAARPNPPNAALARNLTPTPWLIACLTIIAASSGLAYFAHFTEQAKIAAIEERYQQILSLDPDIASNFNVYLTGKELTYLKDPCLPTDIEPRFLLHLTPADQKSLPSHRQQHAFDNLDFNANAFTRAKKIPTLNNKCLATIPLPDYPITKIRTGQNILGQPPIWEKEIPVYSSPEAKNAAIAAIEERYQQIQSLKPDIISNFNVYLTGKELTYFKEPCLPTDTEPWFFLALYPADQKSLPPHRQQHGFDNLDFPGTAFDQAKKIPTLTNKCLAIIPLPDYPITKIQTGQYIPGNPPIWEKEIPVYSSPEAKNAAIAAIEERYQEIQSLTPNITGTFNVYLTGKELTYFKDPCLPTDTEPLFFLHLTPADPKNLPHHRQQHGFDNLDFSAAAFDQAKKIPTLTNKCLATIPLPDYPITKIQTGQYTPNQPPIWQQEIPVHP